MEKKIYIALFVFICIAIIFGTWKDEVYFGYIDKGLTPPQETFCLYEQIESVLAGIMCIWGGVILIYKSSAIVKLLGKGFSVMHIFLTMCFGLMWFVIGIVSLWSVYTLDLPHCSF